MVPVNSIDISENILRRKGEVLDILLIDRTTKKNIIWATDSYVSRGKEFAPHRQINPELVTGIYSKLIQPRAAKSVEEQRFRTKEKGEVFTPLRTIRQMNMAIDKKQGSHTVNKSNWQEYVKKTKLEICCGEGPFIVSRYDPTSHRDTIQELKKRVGFLDRKLRHVSHYCDNPREWMQWAIEAFKSSYGYEWQGDNVLLARENLLYTFIDFYLEKFGRKPTLDLQTEIAKIISWNIFQMDGLKYVIPMSCKHVTKIIQGDLTLFGALPDTLEDNECEGCKYGRPDKHNGRYAKVMDWESGEKIRFVDLLK